MQWTGLWQEEKKQTGLLGMQPKQPNVTSFNVFSVPLGA